MCPLHLLYTPRLCGRKFPNLLSRRVILAHDVCALIGFGWACSSQHTVLLCDNCYEPHHTAKECRANMRQGNHPPTISLL